MSILSGSKLGPYEILGPLGAGGMGEVYRARDTRLGREVAVKVLPARLSADSGFRQRFEREARVISSLNHPHICTLYDVGRHEDVDFLVMEYLQGETLATRLEKGPLPIQQALKAAIEMAGALETAHRAGIVHRDLKPGNIMLTKTGAKLLDFGLAKPAATTLATPVPPSTPSTPTLTIASLSSPADPLTREGAVVGTFQYMAPEVLRGGEADTHSDLFSFGCVLYEMLSGRRAFEGKSQLSVMTAILEADPPPLSSIGIAVPQGLDRLIRTCVEKDPDRRWQNAHDLALELDWIASSRTTPPAASTSSLRMMWAGMLIVVLAVVTVFVVWLKRHNFATAQPWSFGISLPEGQIVQPLYSSSAAISPDGTRIVYRAFTADGRQLLYMRDLRSYRTTAIPESDGAQSPFFSPDGMWIAFSAAGKLKKAAISGGAPQTICSCTSSNFLGGDWDSAGNIYFAPTFLSDIDRVSAGGGVPQKVTSHLGEGDLWPQSLPGGKALLVTDWGGASFDDARIEAVSLPGGKRHVLITGGSGARFVPPDHLIYARAGTLMAVRFDPDRLEVQGTAVPVVNDLMTIAFSGAPQFAVSSTGTLVYLSAPPQSPENTLDWIDRSGNVQPFGLKPGLYQSPRFSPDGHKLALTIRLPSPQIWIYDLDRGTLRQMTFAAGENELPVWSPDGRQIAYAGNGRNKAFVFPVDGSAAEHAIADVTEHFHLVSWSPDGKLIGMEKAAGSQQEYGIWMVRLSGGKPYPLTDLRGHKPTFSPDGRLLAYVSTGQVWITPFPGPGETVQVSTDGGSDPVWSRDSREIFYISGDNMMRATVSNASRIVVGKQERLFQAHFWHAPIAGPHFDIAPDNKRFLVVESAREPAGIQVHVVLNWANELNQ